MNKIIKITLIAIILSLLGINIYAHGSKRGEFKLKIRTIVSEFDSKLSDEDLSIISNLRLQFNSNLRKIQSDNHKTRHQKRERNKFKLDSNRKMQMIANYEIIQELTLRNEEAFKNLISQLDEIKSDFQIKHKKRKAINNNKFRDSLGKYYFIILRNWDMNWRKSEESKLIAYYSDNNQFKILSNSNESGSIEIYDINGVLIHNYENHQLSTGENILDLPKDIFLKNGNYILRFRGEERNKTFKINVQN